MTAKRRDPKNNLFLAGAAGNLLAPSHAGWKRPDGKYEPSYLAGLSITCIAGLDRLIELEKMVGAAEKVKRYTERRDLARKGLPLLTTGEGYFIKSLDPDGTRHGVYGAAKHGYFETVCNHDAICFRVTNGEQSEKIYRKIASIPGLRRHDLIVTNDSSLDDMYEPGDRGGLWGFGTWVNGGHWTTCEARMIMAYYRLGKYDDARRSMNKMLDFARRFRMDNPLVDFGNAPYQPGLPINCVYDNWGAPAAMIRGLFEYLYRADSLAIVPHIPTKIVRLEQYFPIRWSRRVWPKAMRRRMLAWRWSALPRFMLAPRWWPTAACLACRRRRAWRRPTARIWKRSAGSATGWRRSCRLRRRARTQTSGRFTNSGRPRRLSMLLDTISRRFPDEKLKPR